MSAYTAHWGPRFDFMRPFTRNRQRWAEHLALKAVYWTGAAGVYNRTLSSSGATIQMYHSVSDAANSRWIDPRFTVPPEDFKAQIRFLSRHRNVVSHSALVGMLERGENPPAGTVVVTFDDGYLGMLDVAAPILEKYGVPAIAFILTGYIDRGQNQWGDDLFSLFVSHRRTSVRIPGIHPSRVDLNDAETKARAFAALQSWFISALPGARTEMLACLTEEFRPEDTPPRLTMNWDEVRRLVRNHPNIEIGLHGAEHLDMTAHPEAVIRDELDRCLAATQRELGLRPEHFAFPYNRFSTAARAMVREFGFRSAVASGDGVRITKYSDHLALPRMESCRSLTLLRLRTGGAGYARQPEAKPADASPPPAMPSRPEAPAARDNAADGAKVTAVIVSYNSADQIDTALNSLRAAHDAGFLECVVVDNASSDGTAAFVSARHPWVTLVESGANLGYGRGCNLALQRIKTPHVLFMNADATIGPGDILVLVRFLEENPRAGMAAPALVETDGHLQVTRPLPTPMRILAEAAGANGGRPEQRPIHPGDPPFEAEWLCGAVLLADRTLLEELGGFDPRFFLYYEETDLCRRVRDHGRELWAVGGAVARHAAHDSAAKTNMKMFEGCIAEYYFPSRYYYVAKQYGWAVAAATEAGEIGLLAARSLVALLLGRSSNRLAQRLRAPVFRAPKKIQAPS